MKWYNRENYQRYKNELKNTRRKDFDLSNPESIVYKFIDLPETIARSLFRLDETSCGRLNVEDLIQEGMLELCVSSKMIDKELVEGSDNAERVIISYLSERIKGRIRRAINTWRGTIRIPERAIREIRSGEKDDYEVRNTFFFNILEQIRDCDSSNNRMVIDYRGELKEYNYTFVITYIVGVLKSNLNDVETDILRMWYGLDTNKRTIEQISSSVGLHSQKVFSIKKEAIKKIEGKINKGLIVDFLFS